MNVLAHPTLDRSGPPTSDARDEIAVEVYVDQEASCAATLRRLLADCRAQVALIPSDLSFVRGYDKETILDLLGDMMPPADAEVERYARRNFLAEEV